MKFFYISEKVSQNFTHLPGIKRKRKKTQIYTALFLALHHHTDAYVNLKKKNTTNIRIYRHFFRYKNKSILVFPKKKILQRIPVLYHENIVKKTDVNVSIYVIKHACI